MKLSFKNSFKKDGNRYGLSCFVMSTAMRCASLVFIMLTPDIEDSVLDLKASL